MDYEKKQRNDFLDKAKSSDFLDAVFLVYYYNKNVNIWCAHPIPPKIDISEVFDEHASAIIQEAEEKRANLLRNAYVGAAFFNYSDSHETYEEAVYRMKAQNPCFSHTSYSRAANHSIKAMR